MCSPIANLEVLILRNNNKACRLPSFTIAMLTLGISSARATEQCRFIQAKPEREACYQRQEAELAAKRKVEPRRDKTMEALEQMKHEDEALDRQIHSICRGC
jgi:septation ring formation regulator EzrA